MAASSNLVPSTINIHRFPVFPEIVSGHDSPPTIGSSSLTPQFLETKRATSCTLVSVPGHFVVRTEELDLLGSAYYAASSPVAQLASQSNLVTPTHSSRPNPNYAAATTPAGTASLRCSTACSDASSVSDLLVVHGSASGLGGVLVSPLPTPGLQSHRTQHRPEMDGRSTMTPLELGS